MVTAASVVETYTIHFTLKVGLSRRSPGTRSGDHSERSTPAAPRANKERACIHGWVSRLVGDAMHQLLSSTVRGRSLSHRKYAWRLRLCPGSGRAKRNGLRTIPERDRKHTLTTLQFLARALQLYGCQNHQWWQASITFNRSPRSATPYARPRFPAC